MILNIIVFSCPLIIASLGALFSEYGGTLALYLESLISLSGFLFYLFTVTLKNPFIGAILSVFFCVFLTLAFSFFIHRFKANKFIASLGMNLLYNSMISLLSSVFFKTRGVLISSLFNFSSRTVIISTVTITFILIAVTVLFLCLTQQGIYFRITGTDPHLLSAKGLNPEIYSVLTWGMAAFYGSFSGILLSLKISSFVPGLAGGKGWMALAAVFLGKKKWWQIIIYILIFCCLDFLSSGIQNFIHLPSSVILALPYLAILLLISVKKFI